MKNRHKLKQITLYLTQLLSGYEVIPANWGWHIHKENIYCGMLQYQQRKGWQGTALNYLPPEVLEQLKKFALIGLEDSRFPKEGAVLKWRTDKSA
jgi:hypothetical protein